MKRWIAWALSVPGIRFAVDVLRHFGDNNGPFYAAGLAFFLILSLAPIVLSGVALLGYFIDAHAASQRALEIIQSFLPEGDARKEVTVLLDSRIHLQRQVQSLIDNRGVAGLVGLLSLLWANLQMFVSGSVAMNAMWRVRETRNWFALRGTALLLLAVTGILLLVSLALTGAPTAIQAFDLPLIRHLPVPLSAITFVCEMIALLVNTFMYIIIYKVLPNAKVTWSDAAIGGVSASVLFEAAKKVIAGYILLANHSLYGDLADLILLILWIYYSLIILLLGAEVTAALSRPASRKRGIVRNRSTSL